MRNLFAHPKGSITDVPNFEDGVLIDICKKFKGYDAAQDRADFFDRKVARCMLLLSQDQDDKEVAKQLLSSPQKRAERNKEVK